MKKLIIILLMLLLAGCSLQEPVKPLKPIDKNYQENIKEKTKEIIKEIPIRIGENN